ncbi:hypothetical protein PSTT_16919 [Puccinia striiformis]|uniref:Uncharacterized protein n=1 Tax=Puccinia striiformis TaxID=27350 RepID=A0A2S4UAL9_9BASI|nr:hypothetical protein PSTT_16919 [Puccinia striiformis]
MPLMLLPDTPSGKAENNTTPEAPGHASEHHASLPPTLTCFPRTKSHGIEKHHCNKALNKVVFAANQTLDKFSSQIFANYKTCNVSIAFSAVVILENTYPHPNHYRPTSRFFKPRKATLKKMELSLMIHELTAICPSTGGVLSQSASVALKIERGDAKNVYKFDQPVCNKEKCPLNRSDCLSAFYQLPTNAMGVFVNGKGRTSIARATSGNCTITASTTDLSAFTVPRQFILPTMKKLINDCDEHPGKLYISGGTKGYNGDICLLARAANRALCE